MSADVLDLSGSLAFLDEMYERYVADPASVDPSWAAVFKGEAPAVTPTPTPARNGRNGSNGSNGHAPNGHNRPGAVTLGPAVATASVWPLVNAYRSRGHLAADLDPLGLVERVVVSELDPATWGFTEAGSRSRDRRRPACTACRRHRPRADGACCARSTAARSASSSCTSLAGQADRGSPSTWRPAARGPREDVRRRMLELLDQRRGLRALLPREVPRHQAVLARGLRGAHPRARSDAHPRRAAGRDRGGARHGPPRPAHHARADHAARGARDLRRVRGHRARGAVGGGDVKYHLGLLERIASIPTATTCTSRCAFNPSHLEAVDPVVSVACAPSRSATATRAPQGDGHPGPRRRRVRRPGPGHRDAAAAPGSRAIAPAAPSTSSSTTRSASPRRPSGDALDAVLHRRRAR
jgi:2-oxoglutarate dehydrogenase E1 component